MKFRIIISALALLGAAVSTPAMAVEKGDWLFRFGASSVAPKSNNHEVVNVDSATSFTFNAAYMWTSNLSVELLAAYPFEHDINLNADGSRVGTTKHLPPTLSLQYHLVPTNKFKPYFGIGINYTNFFSERTTGALAGTNLNLDDSWGLAGEVGADLMLNDMWLLNLSVRYIDIDTRARLGGTSIGTVNIDPWVYSFNAGVKF